MKFLIFGATNQIGEFQGHIIKIKNESCLILYILSNFFRTG